MATASVVDHLLLSLSFLWLIFGLCGLGRAGKKRAESGVAFKYELETEQDLLLWSFPDFNTNFAYHYEHDDVIRDEADDRGVTADNPLSRSYFSQDFNWRDVLGRFGLSWNLFFSIGEETFVYVDHDSENVTLTTDLQLTRNEISNVADFWTSKTSRSSIDYLDVSCFQRYHLDYADLKNCKCSVLKQDTSSFPINGSLNDSLVNNGDNNSSSEKQFEGNKWILIDNQCQHNQRLRFDGVRDFADMARLRLLSVYQTAIPDMNADTLNGLASVEAVVFTQVFLTNTTLNNRPFCVTADSLQAVRLEAVQHDDRDPNALLKLIDCHFSDEFLNGENQSPQGEGTDVRRETGLNNEESLKSPSTTLGNNITENRGSLYKLKILHVVDSGIKNLTCKTFSSLDRSFMQFLDFSGNAIDYLEEDTFAGMKNLLKLDLSRNCLTNLPTGLANDLLSLVYLSLRFNRISHLTKNFLRHSPALKFLYLDNNQLSQIDGGFTSLDSLAIVYLQNNSLTEISREMFANCSTLSFLGLRSNNIRNISRDAFLNASTSSDGLFIDLSHNALPDVGLVCASLASVSSRLNFVDLGHNKLDSVPSKMFSCHPSSANSMKTINFANNQLSFINAFAFQNLSSLKFLSLRANKIASLPDRVFDSLSSLAVLDLSENRLTFVPNELFVNLKSLDILLLNDNMLGKAPLNPQRLKLPQSVISLNVNNNGLTTLPLSNQLLWNLSTLRLAGNNFTEISKEILGKFPNVRLIDVRNCLIRYLIDGAFTLNDLLSDVYLSGNPLTYNPDSVYFMDNVYRIRPPIHSLDLSNAGIETVYWLFAGELRQVINLDLSNNPITFLPDQPDPHHYSAMFGRAFYLEYLNLSNCNVERFSPTALSSAVLLKTIDLRFNRLEEFEPFDVSHWKTSATYKVLLEGNRVRCSCRMKWIRSVPYVGHYDLARCVHAVTNQEVPINGNLTDDDFLCGLDDCWLGKDISCKCYTSNPNRVTEPMVAMCQNGGSIRFPSRFPDSVGVVHYEDNKLKEFVGNTQTRARVKRLFLDRNMITRLGPNAFDQMTLLTFLSLNDNQLEYVDRSAFGRLFLLEDLHLAGNKLVNLESGTLSNLHSLHRLYLGNNRLTNMDLEVLKELDNMPRLSNLTIGGSNQWKCQQLCQNGTFRDWINAHVDIIFDAASIRCEMENGTVTTFFAFASSCYQPRVHYGPLVVFVTLAVIASTVIVLLVMAYVKRLLVAAVMYAVTSRWHFWLMEENWNVGYDAVVFYDPRDDKQQSFAVNELIPGLKITVGARQIMDHDRDSTLGGNVAGQLDQNISNTRRVIFLVGDDGLTDDTQRHAFHYARYLTLQPENKLRIILIAWHPFRMGSRFQQLMRRNASSDEAANSRIYRSLESDYQDTSSSLDEFDSFVAVNRPLIVGEICFWKKLNYLMPRYVNRSVNEGEEYSVELIHRNEPYR